MIKIKIQEIHAQSTDVDRTKMSLQLVLASLFPPKNTLLEWNKNLNWQPVPYSYEKLNEDSLLLVRVSCPRYHEELQRVMKEDVGNEIKSYEHMMNVLTNITGMKIETPDDVQSLYNTLRTEVNLIKIFSRFSIEILNFLTVTLWLRSPRMD